MKKRLALILAAALSLGLMAPANLVMAADGQEDVVIVQSGEPTTLDPCFSSSNSEIQIMTHIFDPIVTLNDKEEVIPWIATEWEVSEDGLSWTFKMRDDVTFSDGEKMTANDVKYTFDRTTDPELNCDGNYLWCLDGMYYESTEVVDDYTFIIHTSKPCPCITTYLADVLVLPQHYYEGLALEESTVKPLGSGAYTVDSWDTANNIIILKKNHDYWAEKSGDVTGNIETLVWKTSTEESTRVSELISGGADLINTVSADFKDQVESSSNYISAEGTRREFIGITMNNGNEVNKDTAFRTALNYAVDVQTIIDTLRGGESERTGTFANPPYSDPDCPAYAYDVEKAQQILDDAGITDSDGDGFREYNGEKIHEVLTATGHYAKDTEIMTTVASYLEQVGIECEVTVTEWSTFVSQINDRTVEADLWFMTSGSVSEIQTDMTDFLSTNTGNYGVWECADYDAKFAELANTFDEDERMKVGYELQEIMYNDPPIIFFDFAANAYGTSDKIDYTPRADGRIILLNSMYNE